MVSRFRRIGIAGCIAGLLVVAVPQNVPARAAPATQGDPAVGPHARQDAEHASGDRDVVVIKAFSNATINGIVSSSTARQTLITNTINAIAQRGLDGVNIDFEGSTSSSYPNLQADFASFTGQLSAQVHQRWPNAMVSVDTYSGAASWDAGFFNISALAPKVDAFFIMGYDMASGNMPGHAGPNAPLTGWTYND